MLDVKLIREEPERVKRAISLKNEKANVDAILELDLQRRSIIHKVEELKKQRNENSKQVSIFKREGKNTDELIQRTKSISSDIKSRFSSSCTSVIGCFSLFLKKIMSLMLYPVVQFLPSGGKCVLHDAGLPCPQKYANPPP